MLVFGVFNSTTAWQEQYLMCLDCPKVLDGQTLEITVTSKHVLIAFRIISGSAINLVKAMNIHFKN